MCFFGVKAIHIFIKIRLQGLKVAVDLLPESHPIELIEDRLVRPLADPIGLRALHLGLRVIDLVELQEQLIEVFIRQPAVLGAPVCQHPQNRHVVVLEEGLHSIVNRHLILPPFGHRKMTPTCS